MRFAFLGLLAILSVSLTPLVKADVINPAVEFDTTSTLTDTRPFTLGYQFSLSETYTVNALGYWVDGLANDHQVGIWGSGGNLLASTTVLSTDPIVGHFQYDSISNLVLGPGTYTIGGQFLGNGNPFPYAAVNVVTIPGYTWVTDEYQFGSGLNFPTSSTGGGLRPERNRPRRLFRRVVGRRSRAFDPGGRRSRRPVPADVCQVPLAAGCRLSLSLPGRPFATTSTPDAPGHPPRGVLF